MPACLEGRRPESDPFCLGMRLWLTETFVIRSGCDDWCVPLGAERVVETAHLPSPGVAPLGTKRRGHFLGPRLGRQNVQSPHRPHGVAWVEVPTSTDPSEPAEVGQEQAARATGRAADRRPPGAADAGGWREAAAASSPGSAGRALRAPLLLGAVSQLALDSQKPL